MGERAAQVQRKLEWVRDTYAAMKEAAGAGDWARVRELMDALKRAGYL